MQACQRGGVWYGGYDVREPVEFSSYTHCMDIYIYIYLDAFRPVCCLLFLAETTHFDFSVGNVEELRTTTVHFWHVLESIFSGPFLTIKLGKFLKCLAKV